MSDTKQPKDSTDDVMSFSVSGVDIDTMRESARMQAAQIWGVSSHLVKVHLSNINVATRDPFPTDLSTYAAIHSVCAYARCMRSKDPDMPQHDVL